MSTHNIHFPDKIRKFSYFLKYHKTFVFVEAYVSNDSANFQLHPFYDI